MERRLTSLLAEAKGIVRHLENKVSEARWTLLLLKLREYSWCVYFVRGVRRWIFEAEIRARQAALRTLTRDLQYHRHFAFDLAVGVEELILPEDVDDAGPGHELSSLSSLFPLWHELSQGMPTGRSTG